MCGICGWLSWAGGASAPMLAPMSEAMTHRGPDGQGSWTDGEGRIAFAHRRLAVLDPLPRSDQPMWDEEGRSLVFNGEIYNFRELRRDLEKEGRSFRCSGDTELLFAALKSRGIQALEDLDGQFAFAYWAPAERRLVLARDRLGIKALFWAPLRDGLIFASELPALLAHPLLQRSLNVGAMGRWLQMGYVAGEESLLEGVYSLEAGTVLEASPAGTLCRRWYDPLEVIGRRSPVLKPEEAAEELEILIRNSVRRRLVADVPLGCFLSGGLDSALIAGAAVREGAAPETLTICFEGGKDESSEAERMAAALGLSNDVESCSWGDLDQNLSQWARSSGDPLADPSFLPTSLVAQAGVRRWKVALSGDGGDELLSGYSRLRMMPRMEAILRLSPALRRLPSGLLPSARWATKLKAAMETSDAFDAYQVLQGVWPAREAGEVLQSGKLPHAWPEEMRNRVADFSSWTRWRALDVLSFLPERMLAKVDRASMSMSLETRTPLLDHRIVEFLFALPEGLCRDKSLFRRVLDRWGLPQPPKKKTGFEIPLASWLRGPLRQRIGDDLFGGGLAERGWNQKLIRDLWDRHLSGKEDHAEKIFSVAVLLSWLREFGL